MNQPRTGDQAAEASARFVTTAQKAVHKAAAEAHNSNDPALHRIVGKLIRVASSLAELREELAAPSLFNPPPMTRKPKKRSVRGTPRTDEPPQELIRQDDLH